MLFVKVVFSKSQGHIISLVLAVICINQRYAFLAIICINQRYTSLWLIKLFVKVIFSKIQVMVTFSTANSASHLFTPPPNRCSNNHQLHHPSIHPITLSLRHDLSKFDNHFTLIIYPNNND